MPLKRHLSRFTSPIAAALRPLAAGCLLFFVAGAAVPQEPQSTTPPPAAAATGPSSPSEANLRPYVPSSSASASSSASQTPRARPASRPRTEPKAATTTASASSLSASALSSSAAATRITPAPLPPVVGTTQAPTAQQARPISAEDIEIFTDSYVRGMMQRDHVLGVTVAVVQGDTPLLVKGYGYDRLSPVRPVDPNASLFRVGSITKVFTWIVARQEIESGRVAPDAPISQYLPPDIFTEDRRFKPVTLRTLMDHSAGYEDTSLGHLFTLSSRQIPDADSYYRIHRPVRVRAPGLFSSYSNYGPALAARAFVVTSRSKDVPSLMEARIFSPLGLSHTTLREPYPAETGTLMGQPAPLPAELERDLSQGFVWDGAGFKAQPFDHAIQLSGALSASTTAGDMSRMMSLMLAGGQYQGVQLYDATSAQAFRTPMRDMPEGYNGWASGLLIQTLPSGLVTYGHSGATLWFNSSLVLVPELNLGIFISTNTQTGEALANAFPNLLLEHIENGEVRPPLMPTATMAYAQHKSYYRSIEGLYVSTRRAYRGLEGAVTRLINTVEVNVESDGRLILSAPGGASTFIPASAPGFFLPQDPSDTGPARELGGLHFLFDDSGHHVKAFETAANVMRFERVGWLMQPGTLGVLTLILVASCFLIWLSLLRPVARHERPSEAQFRATLVSTGLALLWLLAVFVFQSWKSGLADDPVGLFTRWPSGQVRLASGLAMLAALGTAYQAITAWWVVMPDRHFNDGWALWQKIAHGLLIAYWLFYSLVLMLWGALVPFTW